ncbi:rhotekin-2 [Eurytemora carolleeae]|uniref:rhotekin-2 n=1 Tax=Eurytemora carolleeae TaxID=1294199 RepID=UPI000C76393D|nr:rhotekin-2 [Eurytemora carolleeae]|eukprot:XP_023347091.1 rhotekin-2-like [Eurytemora affinis]
MNTIRRGLKRKEPEREEEYQAGLTQFQAAVRKRESIRLKLQLGSAPGIMEKEIQNKIKIEESVAQGTARFLTACKNQNQALEAAKNLLLGNLRVDMLRFELNKLRRGRGSPAMKKGNPSYAAVSLSDIRIPLLWRPRDHMQDTGDSRKFAVFCIVRVGSQIYDTALISPVDRHSTDVCFNDVLLFSKMPPYFELKLELYSYLLTEPSTSAHAKLVKSISKAVGKTFSKPLRDQENQDEIEIKKSKSKPGPQFDLLATATLRLEDAGEEVKPHELFLEDAENDRLPPLFGQFCCRLAVQPYCREEPVLVGSLSVRYPLNERYSGDRWAENCWARLMDWKLCLWQGLDQYEAARSPSKQIRIDQETTIRDEGDIFTVENYGDGIIEFKCENKEMKVMWLAHLYQHACDHKRWKLASQQKMEVLSPDTKPIRTKSMCRTRSKLVLLYNETKI